MRLSNKTKDKIIVTFCLTLIFAFIFLCFVGVIKLFAETEKVIEVYDTDIYIYETVEYDDCYEIRIFDKNYKYRNKRAYVAYRFLLLCSAIFFLADISQTIFSPPYSSGMMS